MDDGGCLPPLFSQDEWDAIVHALRLSPRQAEIVGLVLQCRTDKEIAAALNIEHCTVRTHMEECKSRLAAKGRISIVCQTFWVFRHICDPERFPWDHNDSK
ncbi:MAG TPA: helix-turn-helix transcriptional regulator [Pirellulales bacterium]|nr:helix-turn-helix transcriptional regulator [Pirellulales bacterium]